MERSFSFACNSSRHVVAAVPVQHLTFRICWHAHQVAIHTERVSEQNRYCIKLEHSQAVNTSPCCAAVEDLCAWRAPPRDDLCLSSSSSDADNLPPVTSPNSRRSRCLSPFIPSDRRPPDDSNPITKLTELRCNSSCQPSLKIQKNQASANIELIRSHSAIWQMSLKHF